MKPIAFAWLVAWGVTASAADLTGNWMAAQPAGDGYIRRTYFNLKQEGSRITGTIRTRQFNYTISSSTGGPDGFTLTVTMNDGNTERRTEYEGTGVGLAVCRRIADRHAGAITAKSQPGKGATFIVTLPFHQDGSANPK